MKRFFSIVLALALVAAWMPMNSITAYAWDSLPSELNGLTVEWNTEWSLPNSNVICCGYGVGLIYSDGHLAFILNEAEAPIADVSEFQVGTYHCADGEHTFTLSAPAPQSQPKTGVMDTLPLWFGVMAVSACAYVLTSKKKVF